ncbi:unnamed protein product [Onchocerca ochengi]|uniref:ADF-H domain-containing protein n=2 Tax=Onchocerca TaxID=6281 RepID=A0A182EB97_ONCOC|nr:unnamed protein product [Onchocerca ochengi]
MQIIVEIQELIKSLLLSHPSIMTGALKICAIPTDLKDELERFRFSKKRSTNALILKIDPTKQLIVLDQKLEDCDPNVICNELPVQQPRYIVISYERVHDDGRLSYPLYLVLYSPSGCSPQLQMMYAGSRNNLAKECELNRNLEIREPDELTKELLESKL